MADDIVTRLRHAAVGLPQDDMNQTAADEIERLRAVLDAIDALHKSFAHNGCWYDCETCNVPWPCSTHLLIHPVASSSQPNPHNRPMTAWQEARRG